MANAPMQWVPSPPAEPPVVGLIASLSGPYLITDDTLRWENGYSYSPEQMCTEGDVTDPCSPGAFDIPANPGQVDHMPMLVRAGEECSTFGFDSRDYAARATRALLAVESKLIAQEFWTGDQAVASGWTANKYLAHIDSDELSPPGDAVSPTVALECLEHALGQCGTGARGMIHCTRELASRWTTLGSVFRQQSGLLQTYLGTIVVPDAGYDGSSPVGQVPFSGSQWAYATGMVTVRRGPIEVWPARFEDAVDRSDNTVRFYATRVAGVTFDPCCHAAVAVDLPLCAIGGAS